MENKDTKTCELTGPMDIDTGVEFGRGLYLPEGSRLIVYGEDKEDGLSDQQKYPVYEDEPEANWASPPERMELPGVRIVFLQEGDWDWLVNTLRRQNRRISTLETALLRAIEDTKDALDSSE